MQTLKSTTIIATVYDCPFYGQMLIIHERDSEITLEDTGDIGAEMYWFKIKKLFLIDTDNWDDITDPDTDAYQGAISYLNELYN